jgi:hypothetical protein
MATLVVPPGFGHLTLSLRNSLGSKVCQITDGFKVNSGAFTQTHSDHLTLALQLALEPLYDSSWAIGPAVYIIGNDGPDFRFETNTTQAGTRATQAQPPPQVTYLIKKTTGLAGRKFRGRAYWPYGGPTSTIDEQGKIIGGEATIVNTAVTQWLAALSDAASNTAGQYLLHASGVTPNLVISFQRESVVATQRRRLLRTVA